MLESGSDDTSKEWLDLRSPYDIGITCRSSEVQHPHPQLTVRRHCQYPQQRRLRYWMTDQEGVSGVCMYVSCVLKEYILRGYVVVCRDVLYISVTYIAVLSCLLSWVLL